MDDKCCWFAAQVQGFSEQINAISVSWGVWNGDPGSRPLFLQNGRRNILGVCNHAAKEQDKQAGRLNKVGFHQQMIKCKLIKWTQPVFNCRRKVLIN